MIAMVRVLNYCSICFHHPRSASASAAAAAALAAPALLVTFFAGLIDDSMLLSMPTVYSSGR